MTGDRATDHLDPILGMSGASRLERVPRRRNEHDFVELELVPGGLGERDVPYVGRVERSSEYANAHRCG